MFLNALVIRLLEFSREWNQKVRLSLVNEAVRKNGRAEHFIFIVNESQKYREQSSTRNKKLGNSNHTCCTKPSNFACTSDFQS